MLATQVGVQRISGITVHAVQEKKVYDSLLDIEVLLAVYSDIFFFFSIRATSDFCFVFFFGRFSLTLSEIIQSIISLYIDLYTLFF